LGLRNYTANLVRFGFSDADIARGGSDRLIDAIIPHGSAEQIAAVARAHLDAGADHVCVQPVGVSGIPREQWTVLAAALGSERGGPPAHEPYATTRDRGPERRPRGTR
jgi:hypothetical protein